MTCVSSRVFYEFSSLLNIDTSNNHVLANLHRTHQLPASHNDSAVSSRSVVTDSTRTLPQRQLFETDVPPDEVTGDDKRRLRDTAAQHKGMNTKSVTWSDEVQFERDISDVSSDEVDTEFDAVPPREDDVEMDQAELSCMQRDDEELCDDGTGDEAMRQDEEESREDAMLDIEEEQGELPGGKQAQEHEQEHPAARYIVMEKLQDDDEEADIWNQHKKARAKSRRLLNDDATDEAVRINLGDLMDDALDVDDPGECMPFYFLSW